MSPNLLLLAQAGQGTIAGGWEYIWAAYGITWAALALYALSLWLRQAHEQTSQGEQR